MATKRAISQLTGAIGEGIGQSFQHRLQQKLREAALSRMEAQQRAEEQRFMYGETQKSKRFQFEQEKLQVRHDAEQSIAQQRVDLEGRRVSVAEKTSAAAATLKKLDNLKIIDETAKALYGNSISAIDAKMKLLIGINGEIMNQALWNRLKEERAGLAKLNSIYIKKSHLGGDSKYGISGVEEYENIKESATAMRNLEEMVPEKGLNPDQIVKGYLQSRGIEDTPLNKVETRNKVRDIVGSLKKQGKNVTQRHILLLLDRTNNITGGERQDPKLQNLFGGSDNNKSKIGNYIVEEF